MTEIARAAVAAKNGSTQNVPKTFDFPRQFGFGCETEYRRKRKLSFPIELLVALTSFAPKPDSWIDPAAYQLEQAVLTHVDAAQTVAIDDQRATRSFGLPGLTLDVDILGIDLGEALTLAFAHRAGNAAVPAQAAGSPAVRRLHWSIVDTTLVAAATKGALPDLADPPLPIQNGNGGGKLDHGSGGIGPLRAA